MLLKARFQTEQMVNTKNQKFYYKLVERGKHCFHLNLEIGEHDFCSYWNRIKEESYIQCHPKWSEHSTSVD